MIDAVRAAQDLPATGAGNRWLTIGGSQGGHAVLSASELSETYAPELELLGTVAYAPGAMLDRSYGGVDPFVIRVVGAMMLYGMATETPGSIRTTTSARPGRPSRAPFTTGCLNEITAAVLSVPFDEYYDQDPAVTEPARSVLLANDVGHVAADSPVLVVQGTADVTVVPQRTEDLVERMCGAGQVTEHLVYDGADHNNIGVRSSAEVVAWLQARLAGEPAADGCGPDPGPFTAHYPTEVCDRLDTIAAANGETREDVVRRGVRIFAALATAGQATPGPTRARRSEGPCAVGSAGPTPTSRPSSRPRRPGA